MLPLECINILNKYTWKQQEVKEIGIRINKINRNEVKIDCQYNLLSKIFF